jgi:hypothetical protein
VSRWQRRLLRFPQYSLKEYYIRSVQHPNGPLERGALAGLGQWRAVRLTLLATLMPVRGWHGWPPQLVCNRMFFVVGDVPL